MKPAFETEFYKVFIDENDITNIVLRGYWTLDTLASYNLAVAVSLDELSRRGKPRLILLDFSQIKVTRFANAATRGKMVESYDRIKFDNSAAFGASPMLVSIVRLMGKVSAKAARLNLFATRDEAVAFLKQN